MKTGALFLLTALCATASLPGTALADVLPGGPVRFEAARRCFKEAVRNGETAGGLHLVLRDGEVIHEASAGFSDPEARAPFRPDTLVRIYSMTKPVVSVAAMRLFEQGRFELDDPVARFIPAFRNATVLEKTGDTIRQVPPRRPITIRDVFRHTTGYSYGDDPPARAFYEREGMRYHGPDEMYPPRMTIAQAAEALARIPAEHHPGERFTYGFSTDLLGRLIEVWSGQPLDVHLRQALFEPLGMRDTGFAVSPAARDRFAPCLGLRDGRRVVVDPAATSPFVEGFEFLSGGGGLVSTARDYAALCRMLADDGVVGGRRLLKAETLRLMFTDQLAGVDGTNRFGLGFGLRDVALGGGNGRRSAAEASWGGYANTDFRIVPSEKLVQIVIRQELPHANALAGRLCSFVYAAWPGAPPPARTRAEVTRESLPGELTDAAAAVTAPLAEDGTAHPRPTP